MIDTTKPASIPGEEFIDTAVQSLNIKPALEAPSRSEGEGPFKRLLLTNAPLKRGR